MLDGELLDDVRTIEKIRPDWHKLAVANAAPMSLPAWMLGWLRHVAPADAVPRIVAVRERGRLVGLAPMFVETNKRGRVDYRVLNAPAPRISPLAIPGREWEVAEVVAKALAEARPRADVIALEGGTMASPWPRALADAWPGRLAPHAIQYHVQASPVVSITADSFEDWLASKSSTYRAEVRRNRRRFDKAGGSTRISTQATLREDVATFLRLHKSRWNGRGESGIVAVEEGMRALLTDVGAELMDEGHLRLILLELDGEPIAAQLNAAAGGEVLCMNGGWDERFAKLAPSLLCQLAGLEDAFIRGDRRLDMGPGTQRFKWRMADGNEPVAWTILMLPRLRLPLTYARTAPMLARRRVIGAAKRSLSDEQAARLRGLRGRLSRR
jgi:CelD/BcsL family acetyltransferase involved in cellulose biosynthesis